MAGVVLDTHVLYWLLDGSTLSQEALFAIGESQQQNRLFVSPITAWEIALASKKVSNPVQLGTLTPKQWFRTAISAMGCKVVPIRQRIALETAFVADETGHGDPADCLLIATARVMQLPLVCRDYKIRKLADAGFLTIIWA